MYHYIYYINIRTLIFDINSYANRKFKDHSYLKVPGPIASHFSQTFGDFGIRRKVIFFSLSLVNFTAEICTVWKILVKM